MLLLAGAALVLAPQDGEREARVERILRSDALPLEGVINAHIQQTYDLGLGPQQSATVLHLQAYGRQ